MKLRLIGHDYKYAVEQIMLSLFPNERPEYSKDSFANSTEPVTESKLCLGKSFAQATTVIPFGGKLYKGVSRVSVSKLSGKLISSRLLQKIIKQSFFKAALPLIKAPPAWGSLTGIRPAHIASRALEDGKSLSAAERTLTKEYHVSPDRAKICIKAAQTSLNIKRTLSPKDSALYVGIPFCPTRCFYCSFVSNSVEKSFGLLEPFVKTLLDEIKTVGELISASDMRINSVYIGGGTPTALSANELELVMSALDSSFNLSDVREYTVEAGRPETITAEKLEVMKTNGAKRVCVNPQSMSEEVLAAIGRKHTPDDVIAAAALVKAYGFALNMDVIAGLPSDAPERFNKTLDDVLSLEPENITIHTLSLKKGSKLMLDGVLIPTGEQVGKMLEYALNTLTNFGFSPYYLYRQKFTSGGFENIGWCLPGCESLYNVCMMEELCSVLALGGGGVTKLISGGRIERIFNAKYPREYILYNDKLKDKYAKIADFLPAAY